MAVAIGASIGLGAGWIWNHQVASFGRGVIAFAGTVINHDQAGDMVGAVTVGGHRAPNIILTTKSPQPLGTHLQGHCQVQPLLVDEQWRRFAQRVAVRCQPLGRIAILPTTLYGQLLGVRARFVQKIQTQFHPAESALLTGILVGDTTGMDQQLRITFRRTGTTHIVALSGFNVTIIISALLVVLQPRFGRRSAVLGGLGLVVIFVVMTGMSSSVMRAAGMAFVVQGGKLLGRPVHPDRLLLLTVGAMMVANPFLFWHDLGFQLSCSSTFALMRLSSGIGQWLRWMPPGWSMRENAAATAAASLASQPIIMSFTGQLPLLSLPTNVIVLPLIPLIMMVGTIAIPAYFLPTSVATVILAPLDALLHAVLSTLQWFGAISWAAIPMTGVARIMATLVCLSLVYYLYRYDETHPDQR